MTLPFLLKPGDRVTILHRTSCQIRASRIAGSRLQGICFEGLAPRSAPLSPARARMFWGRHSSGSITSSIFKFCRSWPLSEQLKPAHMDGRWLQCGLLMYVDVLASVGHKMSQIQQNAKVRQSKSKPLSEATLKRKLNEFSNLMPREEGNKIGEQCIGCVGIC